MFALSVLLCGRDDVYRTHVTGGRGVGRLRMDLDLMDLTPYGRKGEVRGTAGRASAGAPGGDARDVTLVTTG